jgi:hypothetical protein
MGYNTTVVILNDAWDQIKKHPSEFVAQLDPLVGCGLSSSRYSIREFEMGKGGIEFPVGNHCNAASVITNEHADMVSVLLVGGNYGTVLGSAHMMSRGHHDEKDVVEVLNKVLDNYGYKVVKK